MLVKIMNLKATSLYVKNNCMPLWTSKRYNAMHAYAYANLSC